MQRREKHMINQNEWQIEVILEGEGKWVNGIEYLLEWLHDGREGPDGDAVMLMET